MRPPIPRMNMYHSPRPYSYQWRPRGRGNNFNMHINLPFIAPINADSEQYWCETCDRGFPTADALDRHNQQHQKCNIDGCQFVAHPKVITKHIQMQHSTGLYKKIPKLDNPEEIQKWREERKKKYPTRINIEKKAAEIKEKFERGEKMALKPHRTDNSRSKSQSWNKDQKIDRKRRHDTNRNNQTHKAFNQRQNCVTNNMDHQIPAKKMAKITASAPNIVTKNKLKPFTGILNILMKENETDVKALDNSKTLIEDDCYEEPAACVLTKPQEPALCGALTLLMCDYGSSEDETSVKENEILTNASKIKPMDTQDSIKMNDETVNVKGNIDTIPYHNQLEKEILQATEVKKIDHKEKSDDDSAPEEVKTIKDHTNAASIPEEAKSTNKKAVQNTKPSIRHRNDHRQTNLNKHKVPSTLLQKLLHKEIIQERNIVLQCIRYIKMMKYFNKTAD